MPLIPEEDFLAAAELIITKTQRALITGTPPPRVFGTNLRPELETMEIARLLYRFWIKQEKPNAPKRALPDPEEDRSPKRTLAEGMLPNMEGTTPNPSQTLEGETTDRNEADLDGPPPSPTADVTQTMTLT